MIQKRFECWSSQGKTWSDWFDYYHDDDKLERLQINEKWQLKSKLRNEFRVVNK